MIGSAMPVNITNLPTGTQLPSASNSASSSGSNTTLTQNDFFRLMTTQLESQDPLNPMNSDQYAAELAQFSTANGVQQLQTTVSGIGQQIASASGIQASSLVGHNVAVSGNLLAFGGSGSAPGAFNLSSAASDATVTVRDANGNQVASINLGPLNAGVQNFSWNGKETGGGTAAAGAYTFQVNALDTKGNAVTTTPFAVVPVAGVTLGGQNGPIVTLAGGLGSVTLNQIYQIY
ncbi:MAG TPA: FlgD immunoglobulin-like domain containing protein [Stellaceae bacterium]|nr:FlgD immunoglobulin-like domain containing protein [Stellaceae bacterium]